MAQTGIDWPVGRIIHRSTRERRASTVRHPLAWLSWSLNGCAPLRLRYTDANSSSRSVAMPSRLIIAPENGGRNDQPIRPIW